MTVVLFSDAQKYIKRLTPRDRIVVETKEGKVRLGSVRFKEVRCGKKGCTKCPHKTYIYAQYRVGKKVTEKYIGVAWQTFDARSTS